MNARLKIWMELLRCSVNIFLRMCQMYMNSILSSPSIGFGSNARTGKDFVEFCKEIVIELMLQYAQATVELFHGTNADDRGRQIRAGEQPSLGVNTTFSRRPPP